MTPERWQRIEKLFHTAVERTPSERAAFLDEACEGDEGLRREVESLLATYEQGGSLPETAASALAAEWLQGQQTQQPLNQVLGHFRILSQLGKGGMGEVWLAEDLRLRRKIALKLLPKEYTQDLGRVRRFEQEARAASALNHPNILTIYDIGQLDGIQYIATEFIEGQTLRQLMTTGKTELRKALDVGCQVASALSAAHEAGIVHRDIKPENIMARRDGYVKVLDFGLAKLAKTQGLKIGSKASTAQMSTEAGVVLGTVNYMSPEQARGLEMDARTDIFSFGVVLYEMVAGRAPFAGATGADVIASILGKEPPALARFTTQLPETLEWIISKALRKDREERYQTTKEMLFDLTSLKRRLEFKEELERSTDQTSAEVASDARRDSKVSRRAVRSTRRVSSGTRRSRKAITSLAVLPLANSGDEPNMEYLSDGITESIINTLSQLPKLRVVARSTVFRYKDQQADPQHVGRLLGVQAVLTGRVRQIADSLIIGTELLDVASDSQLWGEHFNRNLSDLFAVQEEIAKEITDKLQLKLNRKEKDRLAKRHTHNVEAYQAYLKGRYHWNKRTEEALRKSIEYFNHAIELDPSYAAAYDGLSDTYALLALRGVIPVKGAFLKAKAAAKKALEIDDALGEAHASLAHVRLHEWEWAGLDKEFKRAIELSPGHAIAYHWYSEYLIAMGRLDESIEMVKRAQEIDPLSPVVSVTLAGAYHFARMYDEEIEHIHKALEVSPNHFLLHFRLGLAYVEKRMYEQAIEEMQKAVALSGRSTETLTGLGRAYGAAGMRQEALLLLDELKEQSEERYVSPYHIAKIYAALGEKEQVFAWLERGYEQRNPDFIELKVEPALDSVRSDPRFGDLLRRVGFATPLAEGKQVSTGNEVEVEEPINRPRPEAIAVLPFRPISTEGRDEILELGIADALIMKLSDINQIIVRPTSSIRKYTDLEQDSAAAGRELAVGSVLEGSIQRHRDRIRITARLVRVEDGRSLWTGKFDEQFTDIFAVEDSISEKVAATLAVRLTSEERDRLTKRYTENTAAYHLYLKGRYYWNKRSEESLNNGIECFKEAIAVDPNYTLAYAGLADCYTKLGDVGVTAMTPREAFARAHEAALRALRIDNSLAEVHASLGHLDMHLLHWSDAERDFKRAIELNPNYATAHHWYAYFMALHRRFDDALERIGIANKLDPLSLPIVDAIGEFLYFGRRNDEAIRQFLRALEMDPGFLASRINLGRAYEQAARFSEAEEQFIKARQSTGESIDALAGLGYTYALASNRGAALDVLDQLIDLSKERYVSPYDFALIHAALGQNDEAFRWLEKAYDDCAEWMIYTNIDPRLDPLRTDPRFSDLLRRLGFMPDSHA